VQVNFYYKHRRENTFLLTLYGYNEIDKDGDHKFMIKRTLIIIISSLLILTVSACKQTETNPVTESQCLEDARIYLETLEGFKEMVSSSIITSSFESSHYDVWVKVEFKFEEAVVKGTVILSYEKDNSTWAKKSDDLVYSSALPYTTPSVQSVLDYVGHQYGDTLFYRVPDYPFISHFEFGAYEFISFETDYEKNLVTAIVTQTATKAYVSVSQTLTIQARYFYLDGWTYQVSMASIKETTDWTGTYRVDLGTVEKGEFIKQEFIELSLNGTTSIEHQYDVYSSENTNYLSVLTASLVLGGVEYQVENTNVGLYESEQGGSVIILPFKKGIQETLDISTDFDWETEEAVLVLKASLGNLKGTLVRIE